MVEICGRAQLAPTELKAFCVWRLDWVGGGLGFGGSKPPALRYCGLIKRLVECGRMVSSPTIELLRLDLVVGCLRTVGDTGIALLPALATPSQSATADSSPKVRAFHWVVCLTRRAPTELKVFCWWLSGVCR